jgi:hypothetical protein
MKLIRKTIVWTLVVILFHGICFAGSELWVLTSDNDYAGDDANQWQFASSNTTVPSPPSSGSKHRWNVGFLHKAFAYSTLVLAGITGLTGSDSSMHHNSALGATALGVMTVATGYYEYGDMFEMDEGFSQYNLHIALGTIGALGFATEAIIASTDSGHGGLGIASAIAMAGATVIIYW